VSKCLTTTPSAIFLLAFGLLVAGCGGSGDGGAGATKETGPAARNDERPNFLLILTDDQSAIHTSRAGYPAVSTPRFDALADGGIYFRNAYAAAPTCTASRSAILTGQHAWRLQSAALLWGEWPPALASYQDRLRAAGYHTGSTGKGWGPGKAGVTNPAGEVYNTRRRAVPDHLSPFDYPGNFRDFLADRAPGQPFSFWLGIEEPHRPYRETAGDRLADAQAADYLPEHLPKTGLVDRQVQAYLEEIEALDRDIGAAVDLLRSEGLLANTVIVITSDNGMPFPRGKLNNYTFGVQVPLALYWEHGLEQSAVIDVPVSLTDIAPTFLALAGVPADPAMTGESWAPLLAGEDLARDAVFSAFERHVFSARAGGATYSRRALHTRDWLYIRNNFPTRWPVGDPPSYPESYREVLLDAATGTYIEPQYTLTVGRRPAEELYYLPDDPAQLTNLAGLAAHEETRRRLAGRLDEALERTGDPVFSTGADVFADFPYFGP
jgi:uncharacterized sulfatase